MLIPILIALQAAVAPTDSLEQERVLGAVGSRLDSAMTRFESQGFHGAVLVVRDRRIVLLKGYGYANQEQRVRNTPATRFEQNSITKMFTGASALQLAATGLLKLDDPIERHLGPFPEGKRGATVEQLASHTAGLVPAGAPLAGDTRENFIRDVKAVPREAPPGTQYRYTNAGFSLLAAVVERASGERFEEYVRRNVFARARMRTALFRDEVPDNDPRFARGYIGTQPGPPNPYVWGTRGAGGVWSTVGDIYRWIAAVEDGLVLPSAQRAIQFAPHRPPAQEMYGWHVRPATDSTPPQIDKGGGSSDFQSQLLYFPSERIVIVWAMNNLEKRFRADLNRALSDLARR